MEWNIIKKEVNGDEENMSDMRSYGSAFSRVNEFLNFYIMSLIIGGDGTEVTVGAGIGIKIKDGNNKCQVPLVVIVINDSVIGEKHFIFDLKEARALNFSIQEANRLGSELNEPFENISEGLTLACDEAANKYTSWPDYDEKLAIPLSHFDVDVAQMREVSNAVKDAVKDKANVSIN